MTTIAPNTAPAALKKLFDRQVAARTDTGLVPETELTALYPLLEEIGSVTEGEGRISFVIVVQTPTLTFATRMEKVVLNGRTGKSCLSDSRVTNLDTIPQRHYLAVDVEDGCAMRNTKPSICLQKLKQEGRLGGTVLEGIATVTYDPTILSHHSIDLLGSCGDGNGVPYLHVLARPVLDAHWRCFFDQDLGSLSCRRRLCLGD